ncbi:MULTISPECIES: lipopolysaccharide heptosyltransferase I [Paraburkholderia]|uniref:Lipopolysaccharide heptosyltransferase 1 n=1 Tax=Paraburkholderia madseniana TaxID=2599607 RepID=A0A6N6WJ60_9BURK|nr:MULTISPECIES: lipopolysaccharide heptosyltransferase I [Paraburkholderia]KAE8760682.1 lipopolysaccharide heptosyltransferase I [Paraburkholderia madseniana]MCX4176269.1 lipopolysaccharide heptosyltransferase I [Paraburkholderia madseniana]MDQ6464262.1 lipopolysaccharide heptosyltransferase I [Paraburkholderia madseniana]NPT62686.1 lipopolysaccharide heptosyltransferase I [Paraburkholderia madseniana]
MKRVLIVKVTSLGDIVQALPVAADIKRAFPGVEVDWAADEAFAELVHWSTSVDRVLCAPLRRFKKARRWGDFKAIAASIAELRAYRYDYIIDIHGVYKSAIIAFLARSSKRIGYQSQDLGERGAAFAYTGRFGPRPQRCDAWHGMRISASEALGYEVEGPAVYNLRLPEPATAPFAADSAPVAALFHATSKDDKKWPLPHWVAVGRELAQRGFHVVLPWGSEGERAEAEQIASQVPGSTVLPKLNVTEIAQMIDACALVVGTDTGFVHLAHGLQKRTVMIFVATPPSHFGIEAPFRSISIGDGHSVPPIAQVLEAIDYVHSEPRAAVAIQHGSAAA